MIDLIEPEQAREAANAPPTRWMNWWRIVETCKFGGEITAPGVHPGNRIWPSKDAAESAALELIQVHAEIAAASSTLPPIWLGAYPEGERP